MKRVLFKACAASCFVLVVAASSLSVSAQQAPQQPQASPAMREAESLYGSRKWADAAQAFAAVTKSEPANGRAWMRLGGALHWLGKYGEAVGALEKAAGILRGPVVMYNLACAHARAGNKDKAFEWLNKSAATGFVKTTSLNADEDLASLRDDARFAELLKTADKAARPCMHAPEHRQFDFWVGVWDVQMGGQPAGTNTVERILDGCVLYENWAGAGGGGTGKSFNFYNSATGKWQQTWVSSTGGVLELHGEFKDGKMLYAGESKLPDGTKVSERLTFFDLGPDRVRQFWEQSRDGGKTWTVAFDGMYLRKK